MYVMSASIQGAGMDSSIVCCFDPTIVIARLRRAFPDMDVDSQDYAWHDYNSFKARGAVEGDPALRTAERDAHRRGPHWVFRLPVPDGPPIRGRAERYDVSIWSNEPIPEPLRSRFREFLEELRFADCVEIRSVRLDGNNSYPA